MSNSIFDNRFYFSSDTVPLIKKYVGSTFVIKYGGSAMKDKVIQSNIIQDISLLSSLGIKIILVHGGGYAIDRWLEKLDIEPRFHNGIRVTDSKTIEVVEMVLSGQINKELVALLNEQNTVAVGLSGKDANLITASPLSQMSQNFTGKVNEVNPCILNTLLSNGFLPVVSSIASDVNGDTYNINADTVASAIASSLKADKYIMITDIPGVLLDVNKPDTLIKELSTYDIQNLRSTGIISGGMIPKLDSCSSAVNNMVKSAHIIDGRIRYSLLYELFTKSRIGSMVIP